MTQERNAAAMSVSPALQAAYETCSENLALHDRDRWLAALFVPQDKRHHIHALYAFAYEIARLREIVSEPQLGEIRLQWWREVLQDAETGGERTGEAALNPVSAALLETLRTCQLPAQPLINLIEARRFDLYNDAMPDLQTLEGYCGETVSALFQLSALILCGSAGAPLADDDARALADASGHAGVAYAMTGLMRALPWHASRGQCYVPKDVLAHHGALAEAAASGLETAPLLDALRFLRAHARDHLAKAKALMAQIPQAAKPAFTVLAVTPLHLAVMDKRGYRPFEPQREIAQWRRQWSMWRF